MILVVTDARRQDNGSSGTGTLAKVQDVRPQRPLAPIPRLEPIAAEQVGPCFPDCCVHAAFTCSEQGNCDF